MSTHKISRKIVSAVLLAAFILNTCVCDLSIAGYANLSPNTGNLNIPLMTSDITGQEDINHVKLALQSVLQILMKDGIKPIDFEYILRTSQRTKIIKLQDALKIKIFLNKKPNTDEFGAWFRCWTLDNKGKRTATYYAGFFPEEGEMRMPSVTVYTEEEFKNMRGSRVKGQEMADHAPADVELKEAETVLKQLVGEVRKTFNGSEEFRRTWGTERVFVRPQFVAFTNEEPEQGYWDLRSTRYRVTEFLNECVAGVLPGGDFLIKYIKLTEYTHGVGKRIVEISAADISKVLEFMKEYKEYQERLGKAAVISKSAAPRFSPSGDINVFPITRNTIGYASALLEASIAQIPEPNRAIDRDFIKVYSAGVAVLNSIKEELAEGVQYSWDEVWKKVFAQCETYSIETTAWQNHTPSLGKPQGVVSSILLNYMLLALPPLTTTASNNYLISGIEQNDKETIETIFKDAGFFPMKRIDGVFSLRKDWGLDSAVARKINRADLKFRSALVLLMSRLGKFGAELNLRHNGQEAIITLNDRRVFGKPVEMKLWIDDRQGEPRYLDVCDISTAESAKMPECVAENFNETKYLAQIETFLGTAQIPDVPTRLSASGTEKAIYFFGTDSEGRNLTEGNASLSELLGKKGANLAEMANITYRAKDGEERRIPIPQGFTITTEEARRYFDQRRLSDELIEAIKENLTKLEEVTGKTFGKGKNPLILSVRSGARFSMPGMMDTILNIGLNDETVELLARKFDNSRFAWDSYRRLICNFGTDVLALPIHEFRRIVNEKIKAKEVRSALPIKPGDLSIDELKDIVVKFKEYMRSSGKEFPQDTRVQLMMSSVKIIGHFRA